MPHEHFASFDADRELKASSHSSIGLKADGFLESEVHVRDHRTVWLTTSAIIRIAEQFRVATAAGHLTFCDDLNCARLSKSHFPGKCDNQLSNSRERQNPPEK
jgi:hypothetical protein